MKPRITIGTMHALTRFSICCAQTIKFDQAKIACRCANRAGSTDTRFPILIAGNGGFADLDVSMRAKAISGKVALGYGAS